MKKRIYVLFCLLLLFFLFLGFSRFINKEFAVRVWDKALGYFDMDEMGNLRFFKLENVC